MWTTNGSKPAWIRFEFRKVYKIDDARFSKRTLSQAEIAFLAGRTEPF